MTRLRSSARVATRHACLVAAGFVAGALTLPLLFGQFYYGTDLTRLDLGLLCAIRERVAAHGSWDLSPLLGNGGALLARAEAQIFYPPRWLAVALPPEWGISFEVIFHLALGAATTTGLLRTFGVKPFTAAAAGIGFVLSGTVIDLLRHAQYMVAAAWLPLVWAGVRVALRRRGGPQGVLAVFGGLGGCLLGAEPQAYAIGVGLVAIEVLAAVVRSRHVGRRALALGLTGIAAFLVGLVAWAPALGEMVLTPRGHNLPISQALAWSFTPPLWLGTLLPGMPYQHVQGDVGVTNLWQVLNGGGVDPPWNQTPYLGPILLCAVVVGFMLRRTRTAAIVTLGGALFSLGAASPVLPLLMRLLPFLARFRYPAKYWLVTSLAATVVAAVVIDGLVRRAAWRRRLAFAFGTAAAGLLVFEAYFVLDAAALNRQADELSKFKLNVDLPTLAEALSSSTLQALVPLLLALALLWHRRLRRFLYGVVVLDVIAALPAALLVGPGLADAGGTAPPPSLRQQPPPVVCVQPTLGTGFVSFDSGRVEWHSMHLLRTHLLPLANACAGVRSGPDYSSLETATTEALGVGVGQLQTSAIRALGCTHFVSALPFGPEPPVRDEPFEPELPAVRTFELPDPLPRIFIARGAALSPSDKDAVRRVAASRSLAELVGVVDDPLHRVLTPTLPTGAGALEVAGDWDEPGAAVVRVGGAGGAVVGLRTPFLVGWQAVQAGLPLPVVRVAANQVGAVVADVSAGPITFRYRVPRLAAGLIAALVGLLSFGVAFVLAGRREQARG